MNGCRPLTDQEIKDVAQSLERVRDRTLFVLGYRSGFRISELLSLKVADVFQYGSVVSRATVQRRYMKGKTSSRSVALHSEAAQAILSLIQSAGLAETDFLFQSRKGPKNSPLTRYQAWRILKQAFAKNKMQGKVATHTLRKTFAARVYERVGHDLIKTQRILGHKNVNSTVSYLSFNEAELDDAVLTA